MGIGGQLTHAVSPAVPWGWEARLPRKGWFIALPPPPLPLGLGKGLGPRAMRFHQGNPAVPHPQLFAGTGAVFGRICGVKREVVLGMALE